MSHAMYVSILFPAIVFLELLILCVFLKRYIVLTPETGAEAEKGAIIHFFPDRQSRQLS